MICCDQVCKNCLEDIPCQTCQSHTFFSNNDFCDWVFKQKNFIAIAHNLKGYDGCFVLNYILHNFLPSDVAPSVLSVGSKILSISFQSVKFIDSYSFIPTSLENFSKTFNIHELKKGYFPHLFNKLENQKYKGEYPCKSFYGFDFFSPQKRQQFLSWYDLVKNNHFDFSHELLTYCQSDVKLLKEGCLMFRKIILKKTSTDVELGLDPFQNSITIASLCHLIYRKLLMPSRSIGLIPEYGYIPWIHTSKNVSNG